MEKKRPGAGEKVVEVLGFSHCWRFSEGITAQEALDYVAGRRGLAVRDIAIQDRDASVIVAKQFVLLPGRTYCFTSVFKPDTSPKREFAVGGIVDPRKHYYIPPDVDQLVTKLQASRYCALFGSRQSGKSTMAMAAKEKLSASPDVCVVYMDKVTVEPSWSTSVLWGILWDHLHGKCSFLFPARPPGEGCTEWSFKSLFLVKNLPLKVTLMIDEADTFLTASNECLDDFFSTIKGLRDDPDYNLNGILLIGVETIKDLLEARYHTRRRHADLNLERVCIASKAPSRLRHSPFSHGFHTEPARFTVQDVDNLLRQAESELQGVRIDIEGIAPILVELTGGHKGIVGSCMDYLVNRGLWTTNQWIEAAESYLVPNHVFGQQTYSRILISFDKFVDGELSALLLSLLENESLVCEAEMVVKLRDVIADGVIIAREAENAFEIRLSSPMLRTVILRRCIVRSDMVDVPPNPRRLDPLWVMMQAIKTMDGGSICKGEVSEYSYHFMLFCRLKAVISLAYPLTGARVVPECKQATQVLRERIDILIRDGDKFSKFGFELVVDNDIDGHMLRAVRYAKDHSAQVFVINFTMQGHVAQTRVPGHASLVFVSVQLNPSASGSDTTASVVLVDVSGRPTPPMTMQLKQWDGKLSFHEKI